jgi:hypothetical protein
MNNNNNNNNNCKFLVDDYDTDEESDGGDLLLDTRWIHEYESQIINDEYQLFLKTDISSIKFDFYYLDHNQRCVECIIPMTYSLQQINQISQSEIFSIIHTHQSNNKKYYNFQTLLLYSFDFHDNCKDIVRSLSNYIQQAQMTIVSGGGGGAFIEYTNILSIDVIYFTPLIRMFHEFIGFTVFLYED